MLADVSRLPTADPQGRSGSIEPGLARRAPTDRVRVDGRPAYAGLVREPGERAPLLGDDRSPTVLTKLYRCHGGFVLPRRAPVNTLVYTMGTPRPVLLKAITIARDRADVPSVSELSRRSGVSRNTIYGWTGGKHEPQFAQLSAVAGVLDVPMAYLVDAYEGRLWVDPQTREPIPDARAIEDQVRQLVRVALERIRAEDGAPDRGRAR